MTIPDSDSERRAEAVKASLLARVSKLGRRLNVARTTFDVRAHVANRPIASIALALGLGAAFGAIGRRGERGIPGTVLAALGGLALGVAKDLVLRQMWGAAMRWVDSSSRDLEPFGEH